MSLHPSTAALLANFNHAHLDGELRVMSARFHRLAHELAAFLPDGPEKTTALRKLLEAKDCAVRALLPADREIEPADLAEPEEQLPTRPTIDAATVYGQRDRGACPICGAAEDAAHDSHRHQQHRQAAAVSEPASPRAKQ